MTAGFGFARADGGVELMNFAATAGETSLAAATTLTAASTRLTSGVNRVIPDATHTAVVLPMNPALGSPIVVSNLSGTVAVAVFPAWNDAAGAASGGKIQAGVANAAFSVAAAKSAVFYPLASSAGAATQNGVAGTDWAAVLSA